MAEEKGEQKAYKMRTMARDIEAQKKGSPPADIPVSKEELEPAPAPAVPKKEIDQTQNDYSEEGLELNKLESPPPKPIGQPPAPAPIGDINKKQKSPIGVPGKKQNLENTQEIQKPTLKKTEVQPSGNKGKLLALVSIAVVIVLIIGFEVWWFFIRPSGEEAMPTQSVEEILPPPESTLPSQPEQQEAESPAPENPAANEFLVYDQSESAVSKGANLGEISSLITQSARKGYPAGSLTLLNILVEEDNARRFASLNEITNALKVTINPNVRSMLTGDYNLMVFEPNTFDKRTCQEFGRSDPSCSGPRLGIALRQKQGVDLRSAMSSWEPSMAQDLQALVLAQSTIGPGEFLLNDATYNNIPIRYRNFPIDTITIDYALVDGLLLITTSKSSMFTAIDALP